MIRVTIEAYAAARQKLGFSRREMEFSGGTALQLLAELAGDSPDAKAILAASRIALDGEYAEKSAPLRNGSVVSIIPPVSGGGSGEDVRVVVSPDPVSLDEAFDAVALAEAGAVVFFLGTVRSENAGARVTAIEYEAKADMAERELERLIEEAVKMFGIENAFIRHRTGRVEVGEASVVIAVSAGHRRAAYEANAWLLDELKTTAPIWKHEERLVEGRLEKVWLGQGGG